MLQCILSLVMLIISDVHVLITYSMIVESFFIMLSVSAVLYFRYKRPNMHRPIKVSVKCVLLFSDTLCYSIQKNFFGILAPTSYTDFILHN